MKKEKDKYKRKCIKQFNSKKNISRLIRSSKD